MTDQRTAEHQRLIAALLGPGEPELTCEECFAQLDRYVDVASAGDAPDLAVPGMRAHLLGCPACREDHDSLLEYVKQADSSAPSKPDPRVHRTR